MWATSPAFLGAIEGGQLIHKAEIRTSALVTDVTQHLVDYDITANARAAVRYSGTVAFTKGINRDLLHPYGTQVRIYSGFRTASGGDQYVPVATLRIKRVRRTLNGEIEVTGLGQEESVRMAGLRAPMILDGSIVSSIIQLLGGPVGIIGGLPVVVRTTRDAQVPAGLVVEERWRGIDGADNSLAPALGVQVYADALAQFVIRDMPSLADPVVWTVNYGQVLVDYAAEETDEGVYSIVVARGDKNRTDTAGNPIRVPVGTWINNVPTSPTYIAGDFGEVLREFVSPILYDDGGAYAAAQSIGSQSQGLASTLSLTSLRNPALEPGDVIKVVFEDGKYELHIIDQIGHSMQGTSPIDTRSIPGP